MILPVKGSKPPQKLKGASRRSTGPSADAGMEDAGADHAASISTSAGSRQTSPRTALSTHSFEAAEADFDAEHARRVIGPFGGIGHDAALAPRTAGE